MKQFFVLENLLQYEDYDYTTGQKTNIVINYIITEGFTAGPLQNWVSKLKKNNTIFFAGKKSTN